MDDHNITIGVNAKYARETCGYSQANAAEFLMVDQCIISSFESGHNLLQADMLERLACLYGCEVSNFKLMKGVVRNNMPYKSNSITVQEMQAIYNVNRIAMNLFFMSDLDESF